MRVLTAQRQRRISGAKNETLRGTKERHLKHWCHGSKPPSWSHTEHKYQLGLAEGATRRWYQPTNQPINQPVVFLISVCGRSATCREASTWHSAPCGGQAAGGAQGPVLWEEWGKRPPSSPGDDSGADFNSVLTDERGIASQSSISFILKLKSLRK